MNEERPGLIFKCWEGLLIPYRLLKKGMKNDGRDTRAMAVFFVFGSAREKFQQNMSGDAGTGKERTVVGSHHSM
ncbi:hypothetical protein H8693_04665 [Christensenellaceae bacterium NSJ-63]|uniref:Uncharacterized protein n=1 Tax=Guopingia tenuis TaxID=2763656 RepID=A0A926HWZ7_9FIRM|nr:hypothetical protein [Guopingia tenuis]MBC8538221.1 hypothetical protein [Guopingia tenuis]